MIDKLKELLKTALNRETIMYLIFGVMTTIISIVIYTICINYGLGVAVSNTISTVIAVSFAFVTNKLFVFRSTDLSIKTTRNELFKFIAGRGSTYLLETGLLIFLVDILGLHPIISKNFTQLLIIVLNYLVSKLLVFKK